MDKKQAARWEQRKRQWKKEFPGWLDWMRGYFGGLNPALSEQEQIEALLEEMEYMARPMRERLAEIKVAQHGDDQ